MRPTRSAAALAAVALLSLSVLTACGDDSEGGTDGSGTGSGGGDSSQAADTPDETAPDETTDGGDGGDSGDGGDGGSSATGFADCTAITAEEMATVEGLSITGAEVSPGGGQCDYTPADPSEPSVYLEQLGVDDFADGFAGARDNITKTAVGPIGEPRTSTPTGVGDDAEIVVGTSPLGGGTSLQSVGVVLLGDTIVRVTILQAVDLDEPALTALTTGVLTLVASKG